MKTSTGVAIVAGFTGIGIYRYFANLPRIKVLRYGANKSVQYQMSVNGKSITDTFFLGDVPNLVPAGDGKHFFLAKSNTGQGVVDLSIVYKTPEGGYKAVKGYVVSF